MVPSTTKSRSSTSTGPKQPLYLVRPCWCTARLEKAEMRPPSVPTITLSPNTAGRPPCLLAGRLSIDSVRGRVIARKPGADVPTKRHSIRGRRGPAPARLDQIYGWRVEVAPRCFKRWNGLTCPRAVSAPEPMGVALVAHPAITTVAKNRTRRIGCNSRLSLGKMSFSCKT